MFKFNFNNIENSDESSKDENINKEMHNYASNNSEKEHEQIESGLFNYDDLNSSQKKSFVKNEIFFKKFFFNDNTEDKNASYLDYVDAYKLETDENDSLSKINKTHDLVAGQYEGGLKVFI